MALTAYPTVVFNSSTGSDSAASGAGPATAITMKVNGATTNSTTVVVDTLSGDLDTVAQDGSAVLFITGIGFVRVSTTNNGTGTIVMETALTIGDNVDMAIGGKRATLDATESRRLFAATSSPTASGGSGRWTAEFEDDGSLAITSAVTMSFTAGTGEFTLKSSSTSTRRTMVQSGNAVFFTANTANRWRLQMLTFSNTHATKNYVVTASASVRVTFGSCICGNNSGTNCPNGLATRTNQTPTFILHDTSVLRCGSDGISNSGNNIIYDSEISRCGSNGLSGTSGYLALVRSIFAYNSAWGVTAPADTSVAALIDGCVFDGNTEDGLRITGANSQSNIRVTNNQFTNNGASGSKYGLNFSGTAPHSPIVSNNNFYGNRTAAANGITLDATNLTADPGYTDRTNSVRNYAISSASTSKAAGFPASSATIGAGQSGTTTYVDIGAAQRQESAGGVFILDD